MSWEQSDWLKWQYIFQLHCLRILLFWNLKALDGIDSEDDTHPDYSEISKESSDEDTSKDKDSSDEVTSKDEDSSEDTSNSSCVVLLSSSDEEM